MKNMKINKGIVSLAIVVAGVAGVSQVSAASTKQGTHTVSEQSSISLVGVTVSEAQAIVIARGQLQGTVKKTHLKNKQGKAIWKITIISTDGLQRGDFRIDATTSKVLQAKIKQVGNKDLNRANRITIKAEKEKLHLAEKAHKLGLKKQHQELKTQSSK